MTNPSMQGGVMAKSGVIYAMPQQAERVLRIDPGPAMSDCCCFPDS